ADIVIQHIVIVPDRTHSQLPSHIPIKIGRTGEHIVVQQKFLKDIIIHERIHIYFFLVIILPGNNIRGIETSLDAADVPLDIVQNALALVFLLGIQHLYACGGSHLFWIVLLGGKFHFVCILGVVIEDSVSIRVIQQHQITGLVTAFLVVAEVHPII